MAPVATNGKHVRTWLRMATVEARRALLLDPLDSAGVVRELQESAERLVKAVLCHMGVLFPKVHAPSRILRAHLGLSPGIPPAHEACLVQLCDAAETIEREGTRLRYGEESGDEWTLPETLYGPEAVRRHVVSFAAAVEAASAYLSQAGLDDGKEDRSWEVITARALSRVSFSHGLGHCY